VHLWLQEVWVAARASLRGVLEVVTLAGGTLPASVLALSADPSAWEPHGPSHRRSGE